MSAKTLFALLRAILIAFAACMLLLFLTSALLTALPDPARYLALCAYVILALGSGIGGFLTARAAPEGCVLRGGLAGLLFALCVLAVGLILGPVHLIPTLICLIGSTLMGIAAGYLARPKAPSAASARKQAMLRASEHLGSRSAGRLKR